MSYSLERVFLDLVARSPLPRLAAMDSISTTTSAQLIDQPPNESIHGLRGTSASPRWTSKPRLSDSCLSNAGRSLRKYRSLFSRVVFEKMLTPACAAHYDRECAPYVLSPQSMEQRWTSLSDRGQLEGDPPSSGACSMLLQALSKTDHGIY